MTRTATRHMTTTFSATLEWQYKLARALHQQRLNTQDILQTALSHICGALRVQDGCIAMFDDDNGLRHAFLFGSENDADAARDIWNRLINQGMIGSAQHNRRMIHIPSIADDPRWPISETPVQRLSEGSAVAVPMLYEEANYGVVALLHPSPGYFDSTALEVIGSLIETTTLALSNAALLEAARTREAGFRRLAERSQNERLERARLEQLRHDLAAMTYHDLRGPLQNVQTSLSGVERMVQKGDPDRAAVFMSVAQSSVRQVSRMVKGLLDIERLEQGKPIVNRHTTDIDHMIAEAATLLMQQAAESDQGLYAQVEPSLPIMEIDGDMVLRVIVNLVENAIKHTPAGGSITLRAGLTEEGNAVQISITDTGPGIPPQFRDDIFDKFFRIKHTNAPSGVGLGLAFCRLAVEAHNGHIWVESEIGQGATFAFTLPLHGNT